MGTKILRLLVAAAAVVAVTLPLMGLHAAPAGVSAGIRPSILLGLSVLAIGGTGLVLNWAWARSRAPVALRAVGAAAGAVAAAFFVPWLETKLGVELGDADRQLLVHVVSAVAGAWASLEALNAVWPLLEPTAAGRGTLAILRVLASPPARVVGVVVLVGALASLPVWASNKWMGLVLETLVYVTIATGLNIALGMTGLLVLGHAAFWGVGAYTFAMLTVHWHWNFWIAFPAAGAAAALVGLVLGLPALRLRGDYLAIVTLAFGESIRWIIKNNSAATGGDAGIPGSELPDADLRAPLGWPADHVDGPSAHTGPFAPFLDVFERLQKWLADHVWQPTDTKGCYWFALGLAVACVTAVSLFKRSRHGRAMFALREDETAAKCMGINTVKVKLVAFMSAAMWAGLAGVVHPVYRQQVTPELFNFDASVTFVAMVVLGGLGSVSGSVLGAAVLWILPALLRDWIPEVQDYRMLVFGAVLAAMMAVRPQGIVGGAAPRGPGKRTVRAASGEPAAATP
jgi:branched-chain amino acid transport system permease protein